MRSERGKTTLRCAVYTRVSTEHGLEQEFNSLDNQREASEAYVKSQAHEGWKLIRTHYDDGGYSGGSMDRPALTEAARRCSRSTDRRHRCLQGRPADPLARRLRQAGRTVRRPSGVVRLGHPGVQHDDQHGTIDPERPFILRPVRARGHWRADPGQDRRLEEEGHLDGRRRSARLSGREPGAPCGRGACRLHPRSLSALSRDRQRRAAQGNSRPARTPGCRYGPTGRARP